MAEEEINYASVVFKTKTHSPPKANKEEETVYDEVKVQNRTNEQADNINANKEEETVYDEVKVQNRTNEQADDINVSAGFLLDKKAARRCPNQQLVCCLWILCVILLLGIIAVGVYFPMNNHLKQLKDNQTNLLEINRNLTNLNNKLSSENENLRRDYDNLTVHIGNLTEAYTVLESKITTLTAENKQLETQNQELETQRNNLTEQIRNMETKWNEDIITLAQQIIDDYCPKKNNNRQCKACQKGWLHFQSSCYAVNNAKVPEQKTWKEAQENCRGKKSDLAVIVNEAEKTFISDNSYGSSGINGYWIGLRVEDGRWKWIDGSDLTENSWIQQPTNGQCAISVRNEGWKSVNCGDKKQWICKKKALSV